MRAPSVTISMPTYGNSLTLRRAVVSVLKQTYTDFQLIVIGDGDHGPMAGWHSIEDIDDPRLIRFSMLENHGRYFADAVALRACDTRWFTVHDADDAAEPQWLTTQIVEAEIWRARGYPVDVVQTSQMVYSPSMGDRIEPVFPSDPIRGKGGAQYVTFRHWAHMAGLWRTEWLRSVGGPHPGYRVGYDTFLSSVARRNGATLAIDIPLYTRIGRLGSLTRAPMTGMRSQLRRDSVNDMRRLWCAISDQTDVGPEHARGVGAVVGRTVQMGIRVAVESESRRLMATIDGIKNDAY